MKRCFILLLLCFLKTAQICSSTHTINIVSSADADFFTALCTMIGSVIQTHPTEKKEFLIIDLGLTQEQRHWLQQLEGITCRSVEITNPQMLQKVLVRPPAKFARGWYSWKPVALKMGLDHFDYFLYLDAGIIVLKNLRELFDRLIADGYFFIGCRWPINRMATKYVKKYFMHKLQSTKFLLQEGVLGGVQGITKRDCQDYVNTIYELSKDIRFFIDDGSTPNGFGESRHDQTLCSIIAAHNNWKKIDFNDNHFVQFIPTPIPDDRYTKWLKTLQKM